MKQRRLLVISGVLLLLAVLIRIYSGNPPRVESSYSTGIYPPVGAFFRQLFGWLPFSFGDIFYGAAVAWAIYCCFKAIRALVKRRVTRQSFLQGLLRTVVLVLSVYIIFNLFWGINYNRIGIASQLQLKMERYTAADLENINALLVKKVNESRQTLQHRQAIYPSNAQLFREAQEAYQAIAQTYPFLHYQTASIKSSLWGWLGNYTGFAGYYNPFTGEAQVNTGMPKFLLPYTTCHEMGHQLGYAKEMEANFVGYLAASTSPDTLFHYSVYLDLFIYSNRNLYRTDSAAARRYVQQLNPLVMADLQEWREFSRRHRNPVEPIIRWIYGKYLENNQQPQGVLSYDEVTAFLVAYYKKFGRI